VCLHSGYMVTCFRTLRTPYIFSRASLRVRVFPRKILVTSFPRLALVACFPGYLVLVTCFLALDTGYIFLALDSRYMFSRAWPLIARFCSELWLAHCLLLSCRLKRCFIILSFQVAPIFLFLCFAVLHSLQTSEESDDLGESAQDKKPEVTRRTEQPEAGSSRIDKPPLRRCNCFFLCHSRI